MSEGLTLDQIITVTELLCDQIADLRHKLRAEERQSQLKEDIDLLKIRFGILTHYRNIKIYVLSQIDKNSITNREIINLIFKN